MQQELEYMVPICIAEERTIPTDCEASAHPNKQLFIHSHSEGKCLGGSSLPQLTEKKTLL